MGREATCACSWGRRTGAVKALLESDELIVRGEVRARAALPALKAVTVCGGVLAFVADGERVTLALGDPIAQQWASAIAAPPPSLAKKLGITPETRLYVNGNIDDDALRTAFESARKRVRSIGAADLVLVRTDDGTALQQWLEKSATTTPCPPVWIVYRKGRNAPLGETAIRAIMRSRGFVDTKVASVSERLTALRFVDRR